MPCQRSNVLPPDLFIPQTQTALVLHFADSSFLEISLELLRFKSQTALWIAYAETKRPPTISTVRGPKFWWGHSIVGEPLVVVRERLVRWKKPLFVSMRQACVKVTGRMC